MGSEVCVLNQAVSLHPLAKVRAVRAVAAAAPAAADGIADLGMAAHAGGAPEEERRPTSSVSLWQGKEERGMLGSSR